MSSTASGNDIQLVCFDLGGVIVQICRTWEEGCAAAGLPVRVTSEVRRSRPALGKLVRSYQRGEMDCSHYARETAALCDKLYTPEEIMRIHEAWLLGEYPGVSDIVRHVHSLGVQTAVLSNTNHSHWELMRDYHTLWLTNHRFASHEIRADKPDAGAYRHVETSLGIAPSHILFFDDLAENIEGAKACGWHACQIDHTGDTATQMRAHLNRYFPPGP